MLQPASLHKNKNNNNPCNSFFLFFM